MQFMCVCMKTVNPTLKHTGCSRHKRKWSLLLLHFSQLVSSSFWFQTLFSYLPISKASKRSHSIPVAVFVFGHWHTVWAPNISDAKWTVQYMDQHSVGGKRIWVFSMEQDYVTNTESFVDSITVDHGHIRIIDENFNLHKVRNLSPVLENRFTHKHFNTQFYHSLEEFYLWPKFKHYVHTERHNWWYEVCAGQWSNLKWHPRALPAQIPLISISSH